MGAPEILTKSFIEEQNYIVLARYIFNEILADRPYFGSKPYLIKWNDITIQVDVSCHEEDFEDFQVDQLKLNHISLTDSNNYPLDCEEEIGDLIDELISDYNQELIIEVERDFEFSYQ